MILTSTGIPKIKQMPKDFFTVCITLEIVSTAINSICK